jgi:hypothetical protein
MGRCLEGHGGYLWILGIHFTVSIFMAFGIIGYTLVHSINGSLIS